VAYKDSFESLDCENFLGFEAFWGKFALSCGLTLEYFCEKC